MLFCLSVCVLLFDVSCLLSDVIACCSLCVVCCSLSLFLVRCLVVWCRLFVDCCAFVWIGIWWLLFVEK